MKKKLPALVLALVLLLTNTAFAAEDSTSNFVRSKTYTGQFSDLNPASAHYPSVAALYEYGLALGKTNGTYGVKDNMLVSHILIFAGRIRSLYRTGDAEAGASAHAVTGASAYEAYLAYLQAEGVVGNELNGTYNTAATRAQVAHVLAGILPAEALPAINEAVVTQGYAMGRYIPDVTEYTPYQKDILSLYKRGVLLGSDALGTFYPDRPITRAETASMLARIVDPTLRVTLDWDLTPVSDVKNLGDLVPSAAFVSGATSVAELEDCVQYMLSRGERSMTLRYPNALVSSRFANQVMETTLSIVKDYCEQMYNAVNCTYTANTITLNFSAAGVATAELEAYRTYTLQAAKAVREELWNSGALRADMSDMEKARVYFTWICQNCVYDYSVKANDISVTHIAYSLFHDGKAVCDGYTGAYNLFLKLEGIDCWTQSNDEHIWSVAGLDGGIYHIDTTWGDAKPPAVQYEYFAMTEKQAWAAHSW